MSPQGSPPSSSRRLRRGLRLPHSRWAQVNRTSPNPPSARRQHPEIPAWAAELKALNLDLHPAHRSKGEIKSCHDSGSGPDQEVAITRSIVPHGRHREVSNIVHGYEVMLAIALPYERDG